MRKNNMKIKIIVLLIALLQTVSLTAQHEITFGYDAAGNRNEVNSPYGCPCECPDNRNDWLIIHSDRDRY